MGPIRPSCPAHQAVPPREAAKPRSSINSANGIRTRVWALRGPRPSPLDDSAATTTTRSHRAIKSIRKQLHRPGGNRTPNRRFWRPVLYQLSYGPNPVEPERNAMSANRLLKRTTNDSEPRTSRLHLRSILVLEGS